MSISEKFKNAFSFTSKNKVNERDLSLKEITDKYGKKYGENYYSRDVTESIGVDYYDEKGEFVGNGFATPTRDETQSWGHEAQIAAEVEEGLYDLEKDNRVPEELVQTFKNHDATLLNREELAGYNHENRDEILIEEDDIKISELEERNSMYERPEGISMSELNAEKYEVDNEEIDLNERATLDNTLEIPDAVKDAVSSERDNLSSAHVEGQDVKSADIHEPGTIGNKVGGKSNEIG